MRAPDLDLDLLRCFVVVAESGGFTAAARRLHLTQSAVSLKIRRFEELLGQRVFVRSPRSIGLTAEGEVALGYARRLLWLNQEMVERVAHHASARTLRLGVEYNFATTYLPRLLVLLKKESRDVSLSVETDVSRNLLRGLDDDEFDLVVAASGPNASSHANGSRHEQPLFHEPLFWAQAETSALDLQADPLPIIAFDPTCLARRIAVSTLEDAGRSSKIVYASVSMDSIQAAVRADVGISALDRRSVIRGMKVVSAESRLPSLPPLSMAIYTRRTEADSLIAKLSESVVAAVALQRKGRAPRSDAQKHRNGNRGTPRLAAP